MSHKDLLTLLLAAVAAAAAVAGGAAAPDTKPPQIVSASMLDRNDNARADAVRLTYSERVRHARDADGKYPFRVAGYRILSVSKASGKTILLTLSEHAGEDPQARPAIAYRRSKQGRVTDRASNQALVQVFRATKGHGGPSVPQPPAPMPPAPVADRDGDGTPNEQDCAPDDPQIHPRAADLPDLAFVDANCDGIDGDEQKAIFVSPEGKSGNPGTKTQPMREIDGAVAAAAGKGKVVLAAAGAYQHVEARTGVGIYGGYDPKSWKRTATSVTKIIGVPAGVYARRATGVVLQLLSVQGVAGDGPGESVYGIRAVDGSKLTLQRVAVTAGKGSAGADGVSGTQGLPGGDGAPGLRGACNSLVGALGGAGGSSPAGRTGGKGGSGVYADDGKPGEAGLIGTRGGDRGLQAFDDFTSGRHASRGRDGANGVPGARGSGGTSSASRAGDAWRGMDGLSGLAGAPGNGGGGGGGGGGQAGLFVINGTGNGGGGGGGGGGAGTGGKGGSAGGGSFGIYLHDSSVTVTNGSSITAGNGGAGGRGGNGGFPGPPGLGGKGATHCTGEVGAGGDGGHGGQGGPGGGGGGGAGGPSIGVMKVGTSTATVTDSTVGAGTPGLGGAPGAFGTGGTPAEQGFARPVFPGP